MMRVLFLSLLMSFVGIFSWANYKNPLMRTCGIEQGQFWLMKIRGADYATCFFGEAVIGAETLYIFKSNEGPTDAVNAYKARKVTNSRGGVCGSFGAESLVGTLQGHNYDICRFPDGSLMGATTLWLGPGSVMNESLDNALSKTY